MGGVEAELDEARRELGPVDQARKRFFTLVEAGGASDEELLKRYTLHNTQLQSLTARITSWNVEPPRSTLKPLRRSSRSIRRHY